MAGDLVLRASQLKPKVIFFGKKWGVNNSPSEDGEPDPGEKIVQHHWCPEWGVSKGVKLLEVPDCTAITVGKLCRSHVTMDRSGGCQAGGAISSGMNKRWERRSECRSPAFFLTRARDNCVHLTAETAEERISKRVGRRCRGGHSHSVAAANGTAGIGSVYAGSALSNLTTLAWDRT